MLVTSTTAGEGIGTGGFDCCGCGCGCAATALAIDGFTVMTGFFTGTITFSATFSSSSTTGIGNLFDGDPTNSPFFKRNMLLTLDAFDNFKHINLAPSKYFGCSLGYTESSTLLACAKAAEVVEHTFPHTGGRFDQVSLFYL